MRWTNWTMLRHGFFCLQSRLLQNWSSIISLDSLAQVKHTSSKVLRFMDRSSCRSPQLRSSHGNKTVSKLDQAEKTCKGKPGSRITASVIIMALDLYRTNLNYVARGAWLGQAWWYSKCMNVVTTLSPMYWHCDDCRELLMTQGTHNVHSINWLLYI